MVNKLLKYEEYTRKEVHGIFDPHSNFSLRSGTWGLQGIIPIPGRVKDFVFFVTFGRVEGNHAFEESVTNDGILSWQSQPRQKLMDRRIKNFIEHDHNEDNIFLFLRTSARAKSYTYLGKLAYISHDIKKEQPVHFKWQILEWDFSAEQAELMNLKLETNFTVTTSREPGRLMITESPFVVTNKTGQKTVDFSARHVNFDENSKLNKHLGNLGEKLVIQHEKNTLIESGKPNLSEKVEHISEIQGDGAGYDIKSYNLDGSIKYIEVKTARARKETPFYLTIRELLFSSTHKDSYYLYRIFDYEEITNTGNMFILDGDLEEILKLKPIAFKAEVF